jgi:hypothetical protein
VAEQIADMAPRLRIESFLTVASYGAMPKGEAERNLRCFAEGVLPTLRGLPGIGID